MKLPLGCNIPEMEKGKITMAHGNGGGLIPKVN